MRSPASLCLILVALGSTAPLSARAAEPAIDFQRDVRPILSDKCIQCHGPDDEHREADIRFDLPPAPGDERAIVPGKPEFSELIRRITSPDAGEQMPPPKSGKQLTPAEIATLRTWIKQGAPWSTHWAYVPPVKHTPPTPRDRAWSRNWIDGFVLARLEAEQLAPAPGADRVTLIRRLSFDLRGLPPTPDEVDAFTRDTHPAAYEKLVDRYLASEAYGERMAVYWLDLVRYADTVGYHGDQEHHISPYRDWVIDAFIADKPFADFTAEQLAGDLLPDSGTDQKIASGYNRLLQTSHEGGVQAKEYLAMYAADRIRNLSGVWLGATVGCAQCHNHKFDPYTIRDFYSLAAFFADLDEAQHLRKGSDASPTLRAPEIKVLTQRERTRLAALDARIAQLKEQLAADAAPSQALQDELAAAEKQRTEIEAAARLTMISVAIEARTIRVLPRGNWLDDSGPVVEPAVPAFLGKLDTGERRATRLDLANWLTDPQRGIGLLTARVLVNRYWALLFGQGLSRSLEDFGGQGEAPSHPGLLDHLAWEFIAHGGRTKPLLKQIVMSRTYQQSSLPTEAGATRDPDNRLLARQNRFRLPAEMIRDNALVISGLLVHEIGGRSVRPYQPAGYYQHLNFPKRDYTADTDARQWRRGLYVHWQRQFLHPMLKAFDAPRREECVPQRSRSNTPLAALTLLNDPTFVEAARALAARTLHSADTDDARLTFAVRQAVSRPPDDHERQLLTQLLTESRAAFSADPPSAVQLLTIGLTPRPDDLPPAELAAWSTVARALLNLHETVTRN